MQQGDVLLYQTNDGGNINVENGLVEMSGGLETAVYLALFGGNEDDDGRAENPRNWWGNFSETDPAKQYRSETQNLLRALPATPNNLKKVEKAVERDLAWLVTVKAASSVSVSTAIPGLNQIKITVTVSAEGEEGTFVYLENWKASI